MTRQERYQLAIAICEQWNLLDELEPIPTWLLWEGWTHGIGCARCSVLGPNAPCWGHAECHGYEHWCGCQSCTAIRRSRTAEPNDDAEFVM